jgi:hypothetical protein
MNFKPNVKPVGKSIITQLHELNGSLAKITDVPTDGNYFIIAAPSTWPPFAAKMDILMSFLAKAKNVKVIMVYLAEAHGDDTWPLGFGINSAKTLEDRK